MAGRVALLQGIGQCRQVVKVDGLNHVVGPSQPEYFNQGTPEIALKICPILKTVTR